MKETMVSFSLEVNDLVKVRQGKLLIGDQAIDRFEVKREIGRGANGVVFEADRRWLEQPCAIKVWLNLRSNDERDKVAQGIAEARKMAAASPESVAQIYDADVVNGVFLCSMEYLNGLSLREHLSLRWRKPHLYWMARLYLDVIRETTTDKSAHGDAHDRNVIVYRRLVKGEPSAMDMKLIDFGTSLHLGNADWRQRHWTVVERTMKKLLHPFESFEFFAASLGSFSARPDHLKISYFEDILDGLKVEASRVD